MDSNKNAVVVQGTNAAIAYGQMLDAIIHARFVVVVGLPATGKTHFMNNTIFPSDGGPQFNFFRTDDYMRYPFDEALYVMIKDLKRPLALGKRVCVEGVQGYRLLRKIWQQNWRDKPDLIIHLTATQDARRERLNKRGSDYRATFRMDAMLMKIWKDYEAIAKQPTTIFYDTSTLGN